MHALKAHIENGRIVVDEPLDLPDGTLLTVVVNNADLDEEVERPVHELTEKEREIQRTMPWIRFARQPAPAPVADENDQLERSVDQAARGEVVPHDHVMGKLGLEDYCLAGDTKVDGK